MNENLGSCAPLTDSACSVCPLCGGPNGCKPAQTGSHEGAACWCTKVHFSKSLLERVPLSLQRKACICKACAAQANAESHL